MADVEGETKRVNDETMIGWRLHVAGLSLRVAAMALPLARPKLGCSASQFLFPTWLQLFFELFYRIWHASVFRESSIRAIVLASECGERPRKALRRQLGGMDTSPFRSCSSHCSSCPPLYKPCLFRWTTPGCLSPCQLQSRPCSVFSALVSFCSL